VPIRNTKAGKLLPWGGARNRADRSSYQLTERQCSDLIDAAGQAEALGQPFNRFITLLWERGGIDGRDNAKTTGQFIKLVSDWARRHGYKLKWAWVQEWGSINGAHVHILLHVPPCLDPIFRPMPLRWTKQILPAAYIGGVLDCQKLGFKSNTPAREEEVIGKVHYMLKCAPAALESKLGMTGRGHAEWGKSCMVFGKRLARWQRKAQNLK
jgi:hypothetical protein